jgi:hypothetical protein
MTRIADLLDRDFSNSIEEIVMVDNHDPDTVFTELTEYVATDGLKAEYEGLFCAMAAAVKSPGEGAAVWISGFFGAGKSSFAKNLGYVLANREVRGASASSLFLKRVESQRVAECVEFLNRAAPYETFMFDVRVELPAIRNAKPIAEVMYRVLRRDLDYAEEYHIGELEIALEKEGKLAAFQDLCRAGYHEEWRNIRKGSRKLARCSALLHRFDPQAYASPGSWLNMVKARRSVRLSVERLVARLFDLCEIRRPGKAVAFMLDEVGEYAELGAERLEDLRAVAEQFGKQSLARQKAGKIPGPAWIVVTAHETLQEYCNRLPAGTIDSPKVQDAFKHRIDLSAAGIGEVAARRVLRKKESQQSILRTLFRECGASLIHNVRLARCSRRTEFDEDEFVRFYPYLPHFFGISIDAVTGIRIHPDAPTRGVRNRTVVKQCFEMLVGEGTRLAEQPVGELVSIDKIYDLVEANIPPRRRKDILDVRRRFDGDRDYPGMATRVAKAMCLMEFARENLPRTTENIAALLVQRVTEAPPVLAVAAILYHMREARFIRWTGDGWKLHDLYDLRLVSASLDGLNRAVGIVNPRLPGWHNYPIQYFKKLLARGMRWYTRPMRAFNATVTRSFEEIVWSFEHLSTNVVAPGDLSTAMAAVDRLSMDLVALEGRLAQSEKRNAILAEQVKALAGESGWDMQGGEPLRFAIPAGAVSERTAYVIGLFGTGRRYINELILEHIGERAKYFRDTIRLHPGPTPMIYSGHATMRHVSRFQEMPAVMRRILEAIGAGFAHSIFIYRHPLDSLLTNWIWWRTYLRDNRWISGISQVYKSTDELCVDLERNFHEFKSFADGDPEFFANVPGPPFLSFAEFVEETELHLQSATIALRLEDFMIDPCREFCKIAEVMPADLDLSRLCVARPKTKPYNYLAVKDKVPRFRSFIDGLDAETKRRLESIGYSAEG